MQSLKPDLTNKIKKTIPLRIDPDIIEKYNQLADRWKMRRADIMRKALEFYLEQVGP